MPAVVSACATLFAGWLIVQAGTPSAPTLRTPLEVVSLWSSEMFDYLTGETQAACSGENAATCQRLNPGVCDDTAYFRFLSSRYRPVEAPPPTPARQADTSSPLPVRLVLRNAGYSHVGNIHDYAFAEFKAFELAFLCAGDPCAGSRLQTGAIRRIDVSVVNAQRTYDLTPDAKVLADGPIVAPVDETLKASIFEDQQATYQVRVVAECFTVAPSPREWRVTVHESPAAGAPALGTVIARVTPGSGIEFAYQPAGGHEAPFEPDWIERDWGYTFLLEQTILDRSEDWYLLPARPFPKAVWIQLPGRAERHRVEPDTIYRLSKPLEARRTDSPETEQFDGGTIIVLGIKGRTVEFRKEEPFDMPCGDEPPRPRQPLPTYLIDAGQLYDSDGHLALKPAYTRGC
jgi:hypothetical protein